MEYRFKEFREDNDLTQAQIAEAINKSRGGYANIEAEIANIKLIDLIKFCDCYNLSLDYVCNLTKTKSYTNAITSNRPIKDILSEKLIEFEKDQNVQSKEIAEFLQIQKNSYTMYKSNKYPNIIQTLMLKKICDKYNYSMDWFVGKSNLKYRKNY